jgi:hypothetical protein
VRRVDVGVGSGGTVAQRKEHEERVKVAGRVEDIYLYTQLFRPVHDSSAGYVSLPKRRVAYVFGVRRHGKARLTLELLMTPLCRKFAWASLI